MGRHDHHIISNNNHLPASFDPNRVFTQNTDFVKNPSKREALSTERVKMVRSYSVYIFIQCKYSECQNGIFSQC